MEECLALWKEVGCPVLLSSILGEVFWTSSGWFPERRS
jgi:hypothetical protein